MHAHYSPEKHNRHTRFIVNSHTTYEKPPPISHSTLFLSPSTMNNVNNSVKFHHPALTTLSTTTSNAVTSTSNANAVKSSQSSNPNKRKRTPKFLKLINSSSSSSGGTAKPKPVNRKPDPSAPKITRPCTECGKKFWSWKALFGHMRCHPERQWRGINPPPNLRRPSSSSYDAAVDQFEYSSSAITEEDHEVANCLLILASSQPSDHHHHQSRSSIGTVDQGITTMPPEFECTSCKKVFGSHQALGGHRASHKNVKGCYAINKNSDDGDDVAEMDFDEMELMGFSSGHKCGICSRVFSSGQALGGHKRCHWEKSTTISSPIRVSGFDLNLPARGEDDDDDDDDEGSISNYCNSGLSLDLRLGI